MCEYKIDWHLMNVITIILVLYTNSNVHDIFISKQK